MASIVIDANVAIKILVPTEYSDVIARQVAVWADEDTVFWVPVHFFSEVMNTLRRKVVQRELTQVEGDVVFTQLGSFPLEVMVPPRPFALAWELAKQYQLPSTSDAEYMAVAQMQGCLFWTADRRFVNQLGRHRPDWVRVIGP